MDETGRLLELVFSAVAVVLLPSVALVGLWLLVRWRQRERARQQELARLGYGRLTALPAGLQERVAAVLGRLGDYRTLRLGDVYHRRLDEGDLYLFRLTDKEEGAHLGRSEMLAVVAPGLDLPRFRLWPRFEGVAGGLAAAEEKLAQEGRAGGFREVAFVGPPGFGERYLVFATDVGEMRDFLTAERRAGLVGLAERYRITGVGDTFLMVPEVSPRALAAGERVVVDEGARLGDVERVVGGFLGD